MIRSKKRRGPRLNPASTLLFATLVFAVSASLTLSGYNAVFCDRLAPLGVTSAVAAFLIALAFHLLSLTTSGPGDHARGILGCALLLACVSLFIDVRFVTHYRSPCQALEKQLHDAKHGSVR